jgi:ornithine cyclodeaminase/alanine dehydrogenase-like protein (mu-crystallin family)
VLKDAATHYYRPLLHTEATEPTAFRTGLLGA